MKADKALLIIDIQNDYFDGGANPLQGSWEASEKAKLILEHFRKNKLPIVHVQHTNIRQGPTFFLPNTAGVEIHKNVFPIEGETIVKKKFPNSFRETILLKHLEGLSVTNLVLCGMMTHMCIDTTVRAAKDLGFTCTLIEDACATKSLEYKGMLIKAEDVHHSFLAALGNYFARLLTCDEYLESAD
jgi:nicotinamidase-related amidase